MGTTTDVLDVRLDHWRHVSVGYSSLNSIIGLLTVALDAYFVLTIARHSHLRSRKELIMLAGNLVVDAAASGWFLAVGLWTLCKYYLGKRRKTVFRPKHRIIREKYTCKTKNYYNKDSPFV